jgi:hypothetical protein
MAKKHDSMEREKKTIAVMVGIFCVDHHGAAKGELCSDCLEFLVYADKRLDKCPFGVDKGPCSKCEVHCYKPAMRDKAKEIMRYAGPRMLKRHPVLAVKHLLDGRKKVKK